MSLVFGMNQTELAWGAPYISKTDGADAIARITTDCQGIKDIGASWIRLSAQWTQSEPAKNKYVWTKMDNAINIARSFGLNVLLILEHPNPSWSHTAADYGNWAQQVAMRYGPLGTSQVDHFEIWNEPNLSSFWYPIRATAYTEYLKAAYTSIKAIHPSSVVLTAGLAGAVGDDVAGKIGGRTTSPTTYFQGIVDNGGLDFCDAIGLHPYSSDYFDPQEPAIGNRTFLNYEFIRDLKNSEGFTTMPIWWTEWGFDDKRNTVDEVLAWVPEQFTIYQNYVAAGDHLGPFFWYNFKNSSNSGSANSSYGAVTFDGVKKAVWSIISTWNQGNTGAALACTGTLTAATAPSLKGQLSAKAQLDCDIEGFRSADFAASVGLSAVVRLPNVNGVLGVGVGLSGTALKQTLYQYTFTGTGSTKPTSLFTDYGQGYSVSGGVATNNDAPHSNGTYYSGGIYKTQVTSADCFSEVVRAAGTQTGTTSDMAIVRSNAAGTQWIGATARWGGSDSVQILMLDIPNGITTPQEMANSNEAFKYSNQKLRIVADGNVYSVFIDGVQTNCQWIDADGDYAGHANEYVGFGFQHRYANGEYAAAGIQGTWQGGDLRPAAPAASATGSLAATLSLTTIIAPKLPASLTNTAALTAVTAPNMSAAISCVGSLTAAIGAKQAVPVSAAATLTAVSGPGFIPNLPVSASLSALVEASEVGALAAVGTLTAAIGAKLAIPVGVNVGLTATAAPPGAVTGNFGTTGTLSAPQPTPALSGNASASAALAGTGIQVSLAQSISCVGTLQATSVIPSLPAVLTAALTPTALLGAILSASLTNTAALTAVTAPNLPAALAASAALSGAIAPPPLSGNLAASCALSAVVQEVIQIVGTPNRSAFASATTISTGNVATAGTLLAGDIVATWVRTATSAPTWTVPTNWVNPLGGTTQAASGTTSCQMIYHIVTSAEQTANTVSWSLSSFFSSGQSGAVYSIVLRNVDQSNPIDAINTATTSSTGTTQVLAGLTPSKDNSMVLSGIANSSSATYTTAPSGWNIEVNNAAGQSGGAILERTALSQAGVAIGSTNITASSSTQYASITAAFAAAL
jgi:hypothetical protein